MEWELVLFQDIWRIKEYIVKMIQELIKNLVETYLHKQICQIIVGLIWWPAELLFKPENTNQLIEFLQFVKGENLAITVLGAGSNTLIRDHGIKGA